MKKQIIATLALSLIVLGSTSFANAREAKSYQELTVAQQQTYNKLSEQEKQNTKAIFGFEVYKSQTTPYDISNDNTKTKNNNQN